MTADEQHTDASLLASIPDDQPLLRMAVAAVDELKGESVKVLDVSGLTTIADWMVICTGRSNRHVKRLGETLVVNAKAEGLAPRVEGMEQAEWVLIDLNGVLVHIMQPVARAYYQIEKLWDVDLAAPENDSARS
ncbi:ribosome silencing factor [Salinisphaera sp. Q1T1-3]|nr:ribosome silencing factor [Salinisphaera sp. Q1T1-3]